MIDGLNHVGEDHNCSVCQTEFTDDEGGMLGFIGIIPVAFCPFCFAGICDMVEQLDDREWEGLTEDDKNEILVDAIRHDWNDKVILEQIEAKLKEKNYEGED
jgi:hypothetical protein